MEPETLMERLFYLKGLIDGQADKWVIKDKLELVIEKANELSKWADEVSK